MKKNITILLALIQASFALAQQTNQQVIDSIQLVISSLQEKPILAKAYHQIGKSYLHSNTDSSVYYLLLSVRLASEIDDLALADQSYINLSVIFRESGQYDSALYYSRCSLNVNEQIGNAVGIAKSFYSIAAIFARKGQYDTAHSLLKQNLHILGEVQNTRGLASTYNGLGNILKNQGNYVLALDYYYHSLALFQELGDKSDEAIVLNNIGIVHEQLEQYEEALENFNLIYQYNLETGDKYRMALGLKNAGGILKKLGNLDSAIFNFKGALRLDSLLGAEESISHDLLRLGDAYLSKEEFEAAFQYFHRSLKSAQDPIVVVPAFIGIGTIHIHNNSLDSAKYYLETAMEDAEEVGLYNEMKDTHYLLYELNSKLENSEKAFSHYRNYIEIKDSIFNRQNIRKVTNMRASAEFEQERRKQEIAKKLEINKAESARNIFIVGTLMSAIIAILFYVIYRRKRQANVVLNKLYKTVKEQSVELKALDKTKSHFYSNISHELRTPLTLISGPLEYLLKQKGHDSDVKYYLELMNRNTQQLRTLVDDILDLAKLETYKLGHEKEAVEILSFTKRVFSNFELLAKHRNVNYHIDSGSFTENAIQVDKLKLEKILNNLLSNAFKNTPSGGEVSLILGKREESIYFKIEDNGQGIEAEDLPYIFDRYFQSKQREVVLQGGSGIGLALSKELTKVIGGELTVKSEKGRGSVFVLSIPHEPAVKTNAIPKIEEAAQEFAESSLASLSDPVDLRISGEIRSTILIVEDHPEMQVFIGVLLNSMGNVRLARNGKQAIDILSKENVDLIISDIMMPEMDGHELLKIVRQKESYSSIPFIMLTALKGESHLLRALSIGVDDYLVKPFSPNELIARAKNMIARRELRKSFVSAALQVNASNQVDDDLPRYELKISEKDRELVEQVEYVLQSHLEDENFSLKELANIFCLSYRQIERNIKNITGLTPKQFQQEVAMQHARKLLEEGKYGNSTAIAYSIGIRHVTRFSDLYEKRFGKRPESYFL